MPQYGIDTSHDQTYLRFLFRLGDKRRHEETLFQSFERLLKELGIQIEFNDESNSVRSEERPAADEPYQDNNITTPKRRKRRASFSTVLEAERDETQMLRDGLQSQAVLQALPASERRSSEEPIFSAKMDTRTTRGGEDFVVQRRSLNLEANVRNFEHAQKRPANDFAGNELSDHQQDQIFRQRQGALSHITKSHANHLTGLSEASPVQSVSPLTSVPAQSHFYQPSRTQLLRDANTFQYYRIRSIARNVVDQWCEAALQARNHHEHLHRLATAHDTEILLRQAFEHWRTRLHAWKQAAETERFFARLEKRASRARNLYLLTKAFTHWAQSTNDETHQRRLMRQRILGIKYFHAWRDVTIENQCKVQQHLLKTSLCCWKQRFITDLTNDHKAELFCERSRVRSAYWQWFWSFCERRAPEWQARKLKQRLFFHMWDKSREKSRQLNAVSHERTATVKMVLFARWSIKAQRYLSVWQQAITLHERYITSNALQSWLRTSQIAPLQRQMSNLLDWRIAGTTFALFVNRFRVEKQAAKLERLRVLRIQWTHWNDLLRCHTLKGRVGDRFALEALYKWVVAERSSLLYRLHEQRRKGRVFAHWKQLASERERQHRDLLEHFQDQSNRGVLRHGLLTWLDLLRGQRAAGQIARVFCAPRLATEAFSSWKKSLESIKGLRSDLDEVRSYFLEKPFFRHWRNSMKEAQRQKRRKAYAVVRRRIKMRIASCTLQTWRDKVGHIVRLHHHCSDAIQRTSLHIGSRKFVIWRAAFTSMRRCELDAIEHYHKRLLAHILIAWNSQAEYLWELEETSLANSELQVQNIAFMCLRNLRLKIIELQSQQGKVHGLKKTHEKRHTRNLIRIWRDKIPGHQNKKRLASSLPWQQRRIRTIRGNEDLGTSNRAEDWTNLETEDWLPAMEPDVGSTALPGYLSTPSKRAAHAKAIVQSTTPFGTPFQNRFRAQLNTTPRTDRGSIFGRAMNSSGNRFRSVLEESPPLPSDSRRQNDD